MASWEHYLKKIITIHLILLVLSSQINYIDSSERMEKLYSVNIKSENGYNDKSLTVFKDL
jgi:hypothetical protein